MGEEGREVNQRDVAEKEAGEVQSVRRTQPAVAGFEDGGKKP